MTREEVWAVLERAPPGDVVWGVMADALDELGEDPQLTAALRWAWREGKKPVEQYSPGHLKSVAWAWAWDDHTRPETPTGFVMAYLRRVDAQSYKTFRRYRYPRWYNTSLRQSSLEAAFRTIAPAFLPS